MNGEVDGSVDEASPAKGFAGGVLTADVFTGCSEGGLEVGHYKHGQGPMSARALQNRDRPACPALWSAIAATAEATCPRVNTAIVVPGSFAGARVAHPMNDEMKIADAKASPARLLLIICIVIRFSLS